jgi:hypothetical protein
VRKNGNSPLSVSLLAAAAASLAAATAALVPHAPGVGMRRAPGIEVAVAAGPPGVRGRVVDAESGRPLAARVEIRDAGGEHVGSYYEHLPGAFTEEDGSFEVPLAAGRYSLEVHRGIDYLSEKAEVEAADGRVAVVVAALAPWVRLRERGWVNGDGHAHLYTDERPDDAMAARVRRICLAQGVDFLATCQEWSGYDEGNWREGYAKFSDERFWLHFGAEMPKYRTGHTWWLGLTSTRGLFASAMDETYENAYYHSPKPGSWTFDTLPFPNVPDVEIVARLRAAEGAAAVVPHPTSWWWQPRGEAVKYTTNVGASLPFGLLAGPLWDAVVVMGYDPDHYSYQDLWFHVLDEGYRMPAIAELDGGYEPNSRFYYGSMRTFFQVGADRSMPAVARALRSGRTFVTSGPIVFARVDGRHDPGSVLPADGAARTLGIEAHASGDRDDLLSYVLVFRNGRILRLWDLRQRGVRRFEEDVPLLETESAWYVVKAYGKEAPDPAHLAVSEVCRRMAAGSFDGALPPRASVALTSPFYFRPPGVPADPAPLEPRVRLRLVDPRTEKPVERARIAILQAGKPLGTVDAVGGSAEITMPLGAVLRIEAPGRPAIHRSLYLDYPPHRAFIEEVATGRWLDRNGWRQVLKPGQLPWEALRFRETKAMLAEIDWEIGLEDNERDEAWRALRGLTGP